LCVGWGRICEFSRYAISKVPDIYDSAK